MECSALLCVALNLTKDLTKDGLVSVRDQRECCVGLGGLLALELVAHAAVVAVLGTGHFGAGWIFPA